MSQTIPKFVEELIHPVKESLCGYFDGALFFCEESASEEYDCNEIADDPQARDLCYLLQEKGYKLSEIDTGLNGKIFKPSLQFASPNSKIEALEVYNKAIETIEEEYFSDRDIYSVNATELFIYKAWQAGFRIPWLIYDSDPSAKEDMRYGHDLLKNKIDELKDSNKFKSEFDLANAIYEMAFSKEGLGFKVWDHLPQELGAQKTLLTRWADCSEMSRMIYLMYRYAGLSAEFVWVRQDTFGNPILHMAVAVNCDGREVIVDSSYGFDPKHESTTDIPLLTSLAIYTDNVADQDTNDETAITGLKQSLLYDPTFPLTYLYLSLDRYKDDLPLPSSYFIERATELDESSDVYLKLIKSTPQSPMYRSNNP